MDGLLGPALSLGSALVFSGIAWGVMRNTAKNHAERIVSLETDRAREAERATRNDQRINGAIERIGELEDDMKEVRENWVTRDYLEKALEKQVNTIVNAVAERRSSPR